MRGALMANLEGHAPSWPYRGEILYAPAGRDGARPQVYAQRFSWSYAALGSLSAALTGLYT
jgi:hypothetical protein